MIVQFKPRVKHDTSRIKMLCKGQIQNFTCDTCGKKFEVYMNSKPDKCPHCGLSIDWVNSR